VIQLIADSGSTKTDWRLTQDTRVLHQFQTEGYNPYHMDAARIGDSLRKYLLPETTAHQPQQIHFYGAGCGAEEKAAVVGDALKSIFPAADVNVNGDMLGAARALCQRNAGMAAILGTGSNSCLYNGEIITGNRPALGYMLGDEGSGCHIGMALIRLFLYDEMETGLRERFLKRFPLSIADVLHQVYRVPLPNRFLAGFSKFVYQNIDHAQCVEIVSNSFRAFFKHHILRYENAKQLPLHVTGSVGFYYSNLLRRISEEQGIALGTVTETPIAGLTLYHIGE
jgi:N-acetylglucosamine kinase-like BadF-type ATPase